MEFVQDFLHKFLFLLCTKSEICGNIYDIEAVSNLAREKGKIFMVDAAQSAGVLDLKANMADMIAFSGHKGLMGALGTGGLYVREGLNVKSLVEGGTGSMSESLYQPDNMPDKFECGTQNMPAIAALGMGVRFVKKVGLKAILEHEQYLADYFVNEVKNIEKVNVIGTPFAKDRTGTVSITVGGADTNVISQKLSDDYMIATRSGLHCAPEAHRTLGTIDGGTIRFSFGFFNNKHEIDRAVFALNTIIKTM